MNIEEDLFQKFAADTNKLAAYGFQPDGNKLMFTKDLTEENFRIFIVYDGSFSGRMIDLSTEDEYVNYRREDASGFSAAIKDKYTDLLLDIREHCCVNQYYKSEQAKRIIAHIHAVYGDTPEFLWKAYPTFAAIRKKSNRKWYAVLGSVPQDKLDTRKQDVYRNLIDSYNAYVRQLKRKLTLMRIEESDMQQFEKEQEQFAAIIREAVSDYREQQKPIDDEINALVQDNRQKMKDVTDQITEKYFG